jgi:hypothetical protein
MLVILPASSSGSCARPCKNTSTAVVTISSLLSGSDCATPLAATDFADLDSIIVARRAYRLICDEIGTDAAGIVLVDFSGSAHSELLYCIPIQALHSDAIGCRRDGRTDEHDQHH